MDTLVYGNNAPIVTCSNCACQFKYSTVDIFIDNAMGENGRAVKCPECGQVNPATTQYFDPRGEGDPFDASGTYPDVGVGKDDQGNIITETYATKVALQEETTARQEADTEIYSKFNSAISSIQYSTDANDITRLSYTTFDSSPNTAIDIIINKATTTTSGLMSKEAVQEIADLSERVSDLEGPTRRYLYTGSDNPTADEINNFAISEGLSAPFSGIAVVVASTLHIWHYYTNGGWRDDGKDTVQTANQTTLGIVMGSTDNGKVFVETDGTMSLNGYDDITQNIADINSNLANIEITKANTSDLDNYLTKSGNVVNFNEFKIIGSDTYNILGYCANLADTLCIGSKFRQSCIYSLDRPLSIDNTQTQHELAYLDDIPTNYVTTNTTQNITAQKYFTTTDGVGAIIIQNGDERLFSDGTQLSYTSPNVSKSVAFNAGGNGTYRLYFPEQNGTISTLNDITTSLSNYATLDTVQTFTERKNFREFGTNIPFSVFNNEEDKYLYLHPTYLSTHDGVTSKSVNMYFPNTSGTLATTEAIANSYVTLNTSQWVGGTKHFGIAADSNYPIQIHHNVNPNDVVRFGLNSIVYSTEEDGESTLSYPNKSGTIALIEDITETVQPIEEQVEELSYSVNDIYQILQQEVYTSQDIEQEYSSRETADGADIIDGALETVKLIEGSTVKTTNLIPYPYERNKITVNGVTYTNNNNGSVTINGTATGGIATFMLCSDASKMNLISGTTYTVSGRHCIFAYTNEGGSTQYVENGYIFTWDSTYTFVSVYLQMNEGQSETNYVVYPMLNEGRTASPYMPYFPGLKNAYFQGLRSTGRNLIPFPYSDGSSKTFNGITYTVSDDGSITLNGTATNDSSYIIARDFTLYAGNYYLSGCPSGGGYSTYNLRIYTSDPTVSSADNGSGTQVNSSALNSGVMSISVKSGTAVNNLVFRPMLNYGSSALPYEPYVSHEISLDTAIELPAWDSINPTTGKRIVQSNTFVLIGANSEDWQDYTNDSNFIYTIRLPVNAVPISTALISNKFQSAHELTDTSSISLTGVGSGEAVSLAVSFNKTIYPDMTLDAWKAQLAAWNTAGDPLTVCYQTATATESDISMEDRLPAYKNGSETVIQGDIDNSEYGAENTLTQNYAEVRGTTEGGN